MSYKFFRHDLELININHVDYGYIYPNYTYLHFISGEEIRLDGTTHKAFVDWLEHHKIDL